MSFKPFYIHLNPFQPGHAPRKAKRQAATVLVQPGKDDHMAQVQIAWCSKSDNFCRASGRNYAQAMTPVAVNRRNVPRFLKECIREQGLPPEALSSHREINILRSMV